MKSKLRWQMMSHWSVRTSNRLAFAAHYAYDDGVDKKAYGTLIDDITVMGNWCY